jgi:trimeric autotransporter adhesin
MKKFIQVSTFIIAFLTISVSLFSQTRSGNYINRDSTSVTNPFEYSTIIGPSAGKNFSNLNPSTLSFTSNNTLIGSSAGYSLGKLALTNTQSYSLSYTMIGAFSGYNKIGGFNGVTVEEGDTYVGAFTGYVGKETGANTLIGYKAGYAMDSTIKTVALGYGAGQNAKTANGSVFIGVNAGLQARGSQNTVIGWEAGKRISSLENIIIGAYAGSNVEMKAGNNIFIGNNSGRDSDGGKFFAYTGSNNTFSGNNTFLGNYTGFSNKGSRNTFIGSYSGFGNMLGTNNAFFGENSGYNNKSGNGSVFIGKDAGINNRSGGGNVFLGYDAGVSVADTNISGSVAIGAGSRVTANNSFILGDNQTKVGIGNTAPQNKLEITSAANTSGLRFTNLKSTSTPSTANSLTLSVDVNGDVILVPAATGGLTNPVTNLQVLSGTAGVSGLKLNNLLSTSTVATANGKALSVDATGNVILVPVTTPVIPIGADVWDQLTNGADYLIRNKNNKSVMIGTVAATKTSIDYKLYVEKGILAEKVKVSTTANWPDYVFEKNYSLMPLKEVENYITANNHLPEVPSAEVIAKDGLDLGKMDATLLKKVEELTLYLIEQNKKIEVLQNELTILKAKK